MKLGKEEIQKIVLSVMLFAGVIYGYFSFLLGPLDKSEANAKATIATLEPQIAEAKKQSIKTSAMEHDASATDQMLKRINALIPEGAPVAWFPPRMAEFFKQHGIDKAVTHLTTEAPEKDLTGFRKLGWTIDLPRAEFATLGAALAALENDEPLLEINNVSVDAGKEEPQFQHATLIVSTLVKQ